MSQSAIAGLSFSGADCKAYATVPYRFFKNTYSRGRDKNKQLPGLVKLKDLQTISVSLYRDISPVRALGHRNARSFTRGQRTIAGSLIFAVIDEHPLQSLLDTWVYDYSYDVGYWDGHNFPDQIPPFNIHLVYSAELPSKYLNGETVRKHDQQPAHGSLTLFGISLTNDGMVTSIEDLLTENTYQYVARDLWIYSGPSNSRDPKNPFSSENQSGNRILADDMRLDAILGVDPSMSNGEASALSHSISSSQPQQNVEIVNTSFDSREQIVRELDRAYSESTFLGQPISRAREILYTPK